jgi:pyridine nucleotide-disulfide oxidoreductase family protein
MKRLILAGGGHAHLHVLRSLATTHWPDVEVVLISPHPRQIYSGMLPGWIAGHYRIDQCAAALKPLAEAGGVRILQDHVIGIDADQRIVRCAGVGKLAGDIEYDLISLDTGALVDASALATTDATLLPIRPLEAFVAGWERQLDRFTQAGSARLAVVGAGAAGVELALAVRTRLANLLGADRATVVLIEGRGVLAGHGDRVIRAVSRQLALHGVVRLAGHVAGAPGGLVFADGRMLAVDCVIGTTGAIPAPWLATSTLALANDGFIAVDATQRSTSHPQVFAAGDVASRVDRPHAKSGVYAVRAGPPLCHNLRQSLAGKPLQRHDPQQRSLYLLATGPKVAVVSWAGFTATGAWAWRWKDWIDRRFMRQYEIN